MFSCTMIRLVYNSTFVEIYIITNFFGNYSKFLNIIIFTDFYLNGCKLCTLFDCIK